MFLENLYKVCVLRKPSAFFKTFAQSSIYKRHFREAPFLRTKASIFHRVSVDDRRKLMHIGAKVSCKGRLFRIRHTITYYPQLLQAKYLTKYLSTKQQNILQNYISYLRRRRCCVAVCIRAITRRHGCHDTW